ncbi:hypothetical protein, partial [Parasphingorhabdus sp.]
MSYEKLLEVCTTDRQRDLVRAVEAHYGRVVEAHQSLFGNTDPTNSNRIMRKLKSKIQDCEVKDSAEVA